MDVVADYSALLVVVVVRLTVEIHHFGGEKEKLPDGYRHFMAEVEYFEFHRWSTQVEKVHRAQSVLVEAVDEDFMPATFPVHPHAHLRIETLIHANAIIAYATARARILRTTMSVVMACTSGEHASAALNATPDSGT